MFDALKDVLIDFRLGEYVSFNDIVDGKLCIVETFNGYVKRYNMYCLVSGIKIELEKELNEEDICIRLLRRLCESNDLFFEVRDAFYNRLNIIDLKQYDIMILKIIDDLYKRVREYSYDFEICEMELDEELGQIYANGGIGVEFYYGLPWYLYTPYGKIKIIKRLGNKVSPDVNQKIQNLKEVYGMVDMGYKYYGGGHYQERRDPYYSITKLPWSDEKLPIMVEKSKSNYISYVK